MENYGIEYLHLPLVAIYGISDTGTPSTSFFSKNPLGFSFNSTLHFVQTIPPILSSVFINSLSFGSLYSISFDPGRHLKSKCKHSEHLNWINLLIGISPLRIRSRGRLGLLRYNDKQRNLWCIDLVNNYTWIEVYCSRNNHIVEEVSLLFQYYSFRTYRNKCLQQYGKTHYTISTPR